LNNFAINLRVTFQLLGMCILLGGVSDSASANAWDWDAKMSLGGNYNNNPTLNSNVERTSELFRFVAAYEMDIERYAQGSSLTLTPRITRDYYPDRTKSDLESTDLFLRGNYSRNNARSSYGLSFNVSRQNVLSSDSSVLEGSNGPNDFRADDIRYSFGLAPRGSLFITPRDQLLFGATLNMTRFELDYSGRSDFETGGLSGSYSHQLNSRQKIGFSGFYNLSRSEGTSCRTDLNAEAGNKPLPQPPNTNCDRTFSPYLVSATNENESNGLNLSLDYSFDVSPTLALGASVGIQNTNSTLTIEDSNGATILIDPNTCDPNGDITSCQPLVESETDFSSTSYNIKVKKLTEKTTYQASASRSVSASQLGTPQDRYKIGLTAKTELTSRFNSDINLAVSRQQSIILAAEDSSSTELFTYFYSAQLKFTYTLNRRWNISGTYKFKYRDKDQLVNEPLTAQGSSIGLGMGYKFKRKQ
jgi:hypothetical protein